MNKKNRRLIEKWSCVLLCMLLLFLPILAAGADANEAAGQGRREPNDVNVPPRPEHKHAAFGERVRERARMVV